MSSKQTIACFGATGGCVGMALACALRGEHHCTALARSPDKLRTYLVEEHDISASTMERYLTIYEGDVKEPADVARALVSPLGDGLVVDVILSGVGAYPTFHWSITCPLPLTDPTICETAIGAIYQALETRATADESYNGVEKKPLLVVVSTAGCGRRRGIPLPVYLPYHYLLSSPLADKKNMEARILADQGVHVRDSVILRPLFLTDGPARGDEALRLGWEWGAEPAADTHAAAVREREPGPALGYSVSRRDVGQWAFDKVLAPAGGGWEGKCVYLTY